MRVHAARVRFGFVVHVAREMVRARRAFWIAIVRGYAALAFALQSFLAALGRVVHFWRAIVRALSADAIVTVRV